MDIIEINPSKNPVKTGHGIVLLALGHSLYGKLAVNLAVGLKKVQPDIKIALVHTNSAVLELDEAQKFLFDFKIICPLEYAMIGTDTCYVKPKLFLDKLTPFQETLFLDVDMVWSPYRKPSEVFKEYQGLIFTMANRGRAKGAAGHSDWVDMGLMKQNFDMDEWIDLSSEWIYFKQNEKTAELFEKAREVYDDPKLICKQFAGGKPDEPAFCIAMFKTGIFPHATPYYPTYWEPVQRHKPKEVMMRDFYAISLGGKYISDRIRKEADTIVKHYAYHRGISVFPNVSKQKYLKERALI